MPYGTKLGILAEIELKRAEAERAAEQLRQLEAKKEELLKLCLINGYCPECATKARAKEVTDELRAAGAYFEKCDCGTDYVVRVNGG